jgi:mycothiol synthase
MVVPITSLDPRTATAEELGTAYELRLACHREGAAGEPMQTGPEWVSMNLLVPSHLRRWHWTTAGGYANLVWLTGTNSANSELCVEAGHRRHGIGRALLDTVRDQARRLGCRTLIGSHATVAGAAFASACGAKIGNAQYRSVLVMPPRRAAAPVPGYSLRSWTSRAPDELLDSYAAARNAVNDSPQTEGSAEDTWTPEIVREFEAVVAERGRETRVTVALDEAGAVVGFTELRLSPEPGAVARTEDTATVAAHRGRGIATWVKSESLRLLAAQRPDVVQVTTSNDTVNASMLAVNRKLGFRIVSTWTDAALQI